MNRLAAYFLVTLVLGLAVSFAYHAGWRVDALRPDSKEILDHRSSSTLDYAHMDFSLRPTPPTYAVTLTDPRKVLFSRKALHRDLCNHLLVNHYSILRAAPFTHYALFGLVSRRAPVSIEVDRSKNELNPFMLLSAMSHQTENSVDPFIVQRERVREVITLHPDDRCTPATQ